MGHEFDFPIPKAYEYRDYVIRAFNADVPYNQFVVEHLAGDPLKKPLSLDASGEINESISGTGFFQLGENVHSPVDVRQHEADRFDNMIEVSCKAFLGLTVNCARCHDHKFDAIGSADYYSLYGYLKSSSCTLCAARDQPVRTRTRRRCPERMQKQTRRDVASELGNSECAALPESIRQIPPTNEVRAAESAPHLAATVCALRRKVSSNGARS